MTSLPRSKITLPVLESHLRCRRKSWLQLAGECGETSDYEILLRETRERVRKDAVADRAARKLIQTPLGN